MVKEISFAIIDDEPLAVQAIAYLMSFHRKYRLVASWTCPLTALADFNNHNIELVFLDVQMPKMSGMQFLQKINHPPVTILTTAFSEYAVDAFSLGVREYLLKPISPDRLQLALSNVNWIIAFNLPPHCNLTLPLVAN